MATQTLREARIPNIARSNPRALQALIALTRSGKAGGVPETTHVADRADPVPDEIWDEAARHYDDARLAALVISIAAINAWNRLNAITRQPADSWR